MKKIVYCSQFKDSSGYAVAARGYLRALDYGLERDSNFELKILTIKAEPRKHQLSELDNKIINKYEFENEKEIKNWVKLNKGSYIFVWHQPAPMMSISKYEQRWKSHSEMAILLIENAFKNINIAAWEADCLPKEWEQAYNEFKTNEIIVPSRWNEEVFSNDYKKKKIHYVPHVLQNQKDFDIKKIDLPIDLKNKHVFLSISQWHVRKGFDKLLQAYYSEFKHQKDVVLIIKSYIEASNSTKQQFETMKKEIEYFKNSIFLEDHKHPTAQIILIPQIISRPEMNYLYSVSDTFVLATRSEGFGLGFAEAASHGLNIICPAVGGHVEIMEQYNGPRYGFQGTWEPFLSRPEYHCDMNWYEPSLNSIRKGLRMFYEYKVEKNIERTFNFEYFSKETVYNTMKNILEI